ncbi:MAG: acetate--CoA ligase family protein [Pseudomonadota bacterium]
MKPFSHLLSPTTIAVFGGKECERVVEQCDRFGFAGTIWPVHPTRETLGGRPCFRSVSDLPSPPDAAYIAVNRERSIDVVRDLATIGAGGAICYASGFAEADAESEGSGDLQRRLVEAAGDMPIIGPNCYGTINALEGAALWPDQHGVRRCEEGVAIITQSSNIAINLTMQKRGLPIAMVLTAGNQAQIGVSKLGLEMIEDERITALGLHIEGLDDVKAFESLAMRARELRKPIVAIKVGKSDQAQAAAMTHTASLAGSDAAHDALFRRLGVARVHDVETFLETLKLLHCGGPLAGRDILSLSCSGGEASLMADAAHGTSLNYRPFEDADRQAVKDVLGDIVTIANPLDYHTFIWGNWSAMIRMFEAALAPQFDLAFLVIDFPRDDQCDPLDWKCAADSFVAAVRQTGARAAVLASMPECMPEAVADNLLKQGIAPLSGFDAAIAAAEAAAMIGECWRGEPPAPLLASPASSGSGTEILDEHQSKQELAATGLVIPKSTILTIDPEPDYKVFTVVESDDMPDPSFSFSAIPETLNPPFALKVLGIAHKTEADAVRLNLHTRRDVEHALKAMAHLGDRFLLEEMAAAPDAELLVGATRDPVVDLMLTLGAGGVLAELLNDTVTLLLPASEREIRDALSGLKIGQLLDGYRGKEATDIDALIANIICIANYASANHEVLEELDVNPLFATQFGSVAVDALIIKRKTS